MNNLFKINKLSSNQRASCWLELIVASSIFLAILILRIIPTGKYFFCVFHKITTLPCVFCGMTRSLQQCMIGNFNNAINFHFFGPLLFFVLIYWGCYRIFCVVSGYSLTPNFISKKMKKFAFYIIAIILIIYWVLRLLQVDTFLLPE